MTLVNFSQLLLEKWEELISVPAIDKQIHTNIIWGLTTPIYYFLMNALAQRSLLIYMIEMSSLFRKKKYFYSRVIWKSNKWLYVLDLKITDAVSRSVNTLMFTF